eukprot:2890636-Rhodomonas_salina.5
MCAGGGGLGAATGAAPGGSGGAVTQMIAQTQFLALTSRVMFCCVVTPFLLPRARSFHHGSAT